MADSKISALTAITSLGNSDEMVVASSGASRKITGANLKASMPTGGGGGGVGALLYSLVLTSAAAAIDTGAGGIAGGYNILEVFIVAQTDDTSAAVVASITLNNDTGANYDRQVVTGTGGSVGGSASLAQTSWLLNAHGNASTTQYAGTFHLAFPGYAGTTFYKTGRIQTNILDANSANVVVADHALGYRSTSAITQLKVAPLTAGKNLRAGSAVYIYGR